MKKIIAISALLIFFLAQFGRIVNFCFCKLAVYEQTNSFDCDCERVLFSAIKSDHKAADLPNQNISSQLRAEELFHPVGISFKAITHAIDLITWPNKSAEALCHRFGNSIFRPPSFVA